MQVHVFFASVVGVLATTAAASAQRVVSLNINKSPVDPQLIRRRRDIGSYSQVVTNNMSAYSYYAEVTIGTPPQPITLVLDTGSSDTWVVDKSTDGCEGGDLCLTPSSSTVKMLDNTQFEITYGDQSNVSGTWMKDNLAIGGAATKNLQMGIATTVNKVYTGILGLGLRAAEIPPGNYPNIMDVFYDQGLIGTKAFSLYLNAVEAPSGTVLFGGIDKAKFTGELLAVPLVPNSATQSSSFYFVTLDTFSMTFGNGTSSEPFSGAPRAVLLDSGATLTYLANSTVQRLYKALNNTVFEDGSQVTQDGELAFVNCDLLDHESPLSKATFDFRFGGPNGPLIRVPLNQMIIDMRPYGAEHPREKACMFGIVPNSDPESEIYILGDSFLRSAYVVYDLANNQLALAQAKPNVTDESDVVEFSKDATGIPGVSGVVDGVSATQTATGLPSGVGAKPLPTVTVTGSIGAGDAAATSATGNPAARSVPGPDPSVLGMVLAVILTTGFGMLTGSMWLCLQI
ncbi:aspartic-type endopeptidase [Apiospora marii]|uniref:Aspartic-type endopeptidase n=1 Tax=Apiospora marii TaxID=335849 RepID=A0ABR1REA6_9PEZI